MDLIHFAQELKSLVKDVPCVDIENLDEAYMSLIDLNDVVKILMDRIEELYYDGYPTEVDFYVDKVIEVLALIKRFNNTFGT